MRCRSAAAWCGVYAVTTYVGNVRFTRPVHSGMLVEVSARLVHTGTTSMHIQCDVRAADPVTLDYQHSARDIEDAMARQTYSERGTAPRSTLRLLAAPRAVNWGGNVHGGRLVSWIDDAANLCATQWSGTPCTSVYAGGVRFYHPVRIGHVVEVEARLLQTGHETLHVSVTSAREAPRPPNES